MLHHHVKTATKLSSRRMVQCTLCDTKLTYHGGTSSMQSHLIAKFAELLLCDYSCD